MPEIVELIKAFKTDLINDALSETDILRKYILCDTTYIYRGQEELHEELKSVIATGFGAGVNDVVMIGSAKLGFSIAPGKVWKNFDVESDIDMAIVSDKLFDDFWKVLYDFNIYLSSRSIRDEAKYRDFLDAFFKGWFRPDLFHFILRKRRTGLNFARAFHMGNYLLTEKLLAVFSRKLISWKAIMRLI